MSNSEPKIRKVTALDAWESPDMSLVKDYKYPAPLLPIEAFGEWENWICDAAESKCAPVDYVGVSLLCASSSLISNVRRGSPWDGWSEPTLLWGALVGMPSSNKSPALDVVREAFRIIEGDVADEYVVEAKKYEAQVATAGAYREKWEKDCRNAITKDLPVPMMPDEARVPTCPPRPRLCISDITIEKAAEIAMQNPRGLCLCRDELAGLLANFDRHGGSDREFYLEAYGGRRYTVDRKKHPEPYIIPYLSTSILGTIQPDKLSRLLIDSDDDGFAARFLYAWPEPVVFAQPKNVPNLRKIRRVFERLNELPFEAETPRILLFTQEAKDIFLKWRSSLRAKEEKEQGIMVSFIGKMPGVIIRLAMTLLYLDWASSSGREEPKGVSSEYVKRAIHLVDNYFIPMGRRALGEYALPRHQTDARIIAKWILRNQCTTINLREIRRKKVLPTEDVQRYEAAAQFLEHHSGWLENDKQRDGNTGTGRFKKTYNVNPRVFAVNK